MYVVYRSSGWDKTAIGCFEDGAVYSGTGWNATKIGEYDRGIIYRGSGWGRTQVGKYEHGVIYRGVGLGSKEVGEVESGQIYSGLGWGRTEVGEYESEGSQEGAAATALLLDLVKEEKSKKHERNVGGTVWGYPPSGSITLEGVIGFLVLVLFGYACVRISWPVTLQTLQKGDYEPIPALIIIGLTFIVGCVVILKDKNGRESIFDIGSDLYYVYFAGLLIQYVVYYIKTGMADELTVGYFFVILFALAIANFGLIFPFYVIQVLVLWLLKKFCFK